MCGCWQCAEIFVNCAAWSLQRETNTNTIKLLASKKCNYFAKFGVQCIAFFFSFYRLAVRVAKRG